MPPQNDGLGVRFGKRHDHPQVLDGLGTARGRCIARRRPLPQCSGRYPAFPENPNSDRQSGGECCWLATPSCVAICAAPTMEEISYRTAVFSPGVEGCEAFVYGEHVRAASKRFVSPRTVNR